MQKVQEFNKKKSKKNSKDESEEELSKDAKEELYVEKILLLFKQKKIAKYVKDLIVSMYRTKDPSKQSVWNTDASRLNYLIRDIIGQQIEWTSDKKGIKLTKYVIKPITDLMREMIEKYKNNKFKITQDQNESLKIIEKANRLHSLATLFVDKLKSGDLDDDICAKLCAEFHLDKNYTNKCTKQKD